MRTPTTNSQIIAAHVAGRAAARSGQTAAMCPYPHYSIMHLEWLKGWVEVKNELEKAVVPTKEDTPNP